MDITNLSKSRVDVCQPCLGYETPRHFSVMIHGIICEEVGCVWAMNRGGYSSMQGSKISKLEACEEDGEGGCNRRVLG